MARILVAFGTCDGQTEKVVRFVADILRGENHAVELLDLRQPLPAAGPSPFDAAVLAGSVRMGKFQPALIEFVRVHAGKLGRVPNAFLALSLSASHTTPSAKREVAKSLDGFVREAGFQPTETLPVAGALQYSKYGFFVKLMMRLISKMAGGDTDASRDYEYTDWNALSLFAHKFAARLEFVPATPPAPNAVRAQL